MEEPQRRQRAMLPDQPFPATADSHLELPPASSASITSSSSNLRDLLTVRQEEDHQPLYQRRRGAGVSLGTVLACEKQDFPPVPLTVTASAPSPSAAATPSGASRTLFDIIRDEEAASGGAGRAYDYDGDVIIGSASGGHKISWRAFKERLRIRRAGAAWQRGAGLSVADLGLTLPVASSENRALEGTAAHVTTSLPGPNPSTTVSGTMESGRPPTPAVRSNFECEAPSAVEQQQGESNQAAVTAPAFVPLSGEARQEQQPQQIRVSLMALLEQTDRQGEGPGFAVSALLDAAGEAEAEEEKEDEEEGGGGDGGKIYVKCCVCMVRHKGAAFIPCGHTFCRLCSRELWVSRGNCPLCNGFILEILDIF